MKINNSIIKVVSILSYEYAKTVREIYSETKLSYASVWSIIEHLNKKGFIWIFYEKNTKMIKLRNKGIKLKCLCKELTEVWNL